MDHIAVAPNGARVAVFDDCGSAIPISALLIGHSVADSEPASSGAA